MGSGSASANGTPPFFDWDAIQSGWRQSETNRFMKTLNVQVPIQGDQLSAVWINELTQVVKRKRWTHRSELHGATLSSGQ